MSVVGHQRVVDALERDLPPVTLLAGPPGVGKWTLAQHLARHHRVGPADRLDCPGPLTVDGARSITGFARQAPFGPFHLIILRLDRATDAALTALLKTLEEPPATARFLLAGSGPTLPTVASRAQVFRLGLLTAGQLTQILIGAGVRPPAAARAAARAGGRADRATAAATTASDATAVVSRLMQAVASHDRESYHRSLRGVDEAARDALLTWLAEAATGRLVAFEDTFGFTDTTLLRRLAAILSATADATPRLSVRAALDPLL